MWERERADSVAKSPPAVDSELSFLMTSFFDKSKLLCLHSLEGDMWMITLGIVIII